jgi:hypothetical protein
MARGWKTPNVWTERREGRNGKGRRKGDDMMKMANAEKCLIDAKHSADQSEKRL